MRKVLIFLIVAALGACGSEPAPVVDGQNMAAASVLSPPPPPPPVDTCTPQIQAWQVALADFRAREGQRQSTCSGLANRQIELNDQYRRLRSEWAFTAPEYEICLRKSTSDERQRCLQGLCTLIEIGGYRCADLRNPLMAIWDGQEQLHREANQNCCSIAMESRLYSALNLTQPAPSCSAPLPPAQPACAQSTVTITDSSNAAQ
jgi:hypothetical protein